MKKIVQTTSLKANSPKGAFYNLAIVQIRDGYLVRKESENAFFIEKPGLGDHMKKLTGSIAGF